MSEEGVFKPGNLNKNSLKPARVQVRSPLADYLAKRKGDKLYIKPKKNFKTNLVEGADGIHDSLSDDENLASHQRSSTTIINDTAQVYTFVPGSKKTQESVPEEETSNNSFERLYNELKDSMMASTLDLRTYNKNLTPKEHFSTILTVSSSSESDSSQDTAAKNSLLGSVTAFCDNCGRNTTTEVIENIYTGSFWEKLFCSFCFSQNSLREFTHVCQICQNPVFQVKLRVDN